MAVKNFVFRENWVGSSGWYENNLFLPFFHPTWYGCLNHSDLEMEAESLTKKLVILEFKYLQNKKWYKQPVKSTRIRKNCFHFTQITDKNLQFYFKSW